MPKRIQRRRTKGWRMPAGAIYVGRPHTFGNPFKGRWAVNRYRRWLDGRMGANEFYRLRDPDSWALHTDRQWVRMGLARLRGRDVACWCPIISHGEYVPCHADVLLSLANDIPIDEVIHENTRRAKGETL